MRRVWLWVLATLLIIAATVRTSNAFTESNGQKNQSSTWRLIFQDNFRNGALNANVWSTCYGWGCTIPRNKEHEWYESGQVQAHNGRLALTANENRTHGQDFISGLVQSNHNFDFEYGLIEIRAKLAPAKGAWSALWLAPEDLTWPPEIDVMEQYAPRPGEISESLHFTSQDQVLRHIVELPQSTSRYHVFSVDWEPGHVTWYIDGVMKYQVKETVATMMYPIANLAVSLPSSGVDRMQYPTSFDISSIKVYQHPGVGLSTCRVQNCVIGPIGRSPLHL